MSTFLLIKSNENKIKRCTINNVKNVFGWFCQQSWTHDPWVQRQRLPGNGNDQNFQGGIFEKFPAGGVYQKYPPTPYFRCLDTTTAPLPVASEASLKLYAYYVAQCLTASCTRPTPPPPLAEVREIIFFISIKLSIKHQSSKIFLAQFKYVHC